MIHLFNRGLVCADSVVRSVSCFVSKTMPLSDRLVWDIIPIRWETTDTPKMTTRFVQHPASKPHVAFLFPLPSPSPPAGVTTRSMASPICAACLTGTDLSVVRDTVYASIAFGNDVDSHRPIALFLCLVVSSLSTYTTPLSRPAPTQDAKPKPAALLLIEQSLRWEACASSTCCHR
ncbi:hypothetical protein L249_8958, partial [Ophiocordyceps polyrhachis-furcata BCC 54312]